MTIIAINNSTDGMKNNGLQKLDIKVENYWITKSCLMYVSVDLRNSDRFNYLFIKRVLE